MKKSVEEIIILLLAALTCAFLSGCGVLRNVAEKEMISNAGIKASEDYIKFQNYVNDGQLSEDGELILEEPTPAETHDGNIQVSFGMNNHLKIDYYADATKSSLISNSECYLNPGDTIYASLPVLNAYTNTYEFSGYRIIQYDAANNMKTEFTEFDEDTGTVFHIPSDYEGEKLVILPLGEYKERTLSFSAVYNDSDGEHPMTGTWKINNERINPEEGVSVDSVTAFTIVYDYSAYKDDYYYLSSNPECFKYSDEAGLVEFFETDPLDKNSSFEIELKRYMTLNFENKGYSIIDKNKNIKSIKINDEDISIPSDGSGTFKQIKPNDTVVIRVASDYKVTGTGCKVSDPVAVSEGNEYTLVIQNTPNNTGSITVSKRHLQDGEYEQKHFENGTLEVERADGTIVTDGDKMDAKEQITLRFVPDDGYYLTGSDVKNGVFQKSMKYEKYLSDIDKLISSHPAQKYISITLDENDPYGSCEYKIDKTEKHGVINVKSGDVIKLKYSLLDSDYEIKRDGILGAITNITSKNTEEVEIKITPEMDGTTVRRDQYISVAKK